METQDSIVSSDRELKESAISPPTPKGWSVVLMKHSWNFVDVSRTFGSCSVDDQIVSSPLLSPTDEKFQIKIRLNLCQWSRGKYTIFLDFSADESEESDEGEDDVDPFDPELKFTWMVYDVHGNPYNIRDWGLVPYNNQFTLVTSITYKTERCLTFRNYFGLSNYRYMLKSNDREEQDEEEENDDDLRSIDCWVFVHDSFGSRSLSPAPQIATIEEKSHRSPEQSQEMYQIMNVATTSAGDDQLQEVKKRK